MEICCRLLLLLILYLFTIEAYTKSTCPASKQRGTGNRSVQRISYRPSTGDALNLSIRILRLHEYLA